VASGERLPLKQEQLRINGWAMEARLYAENPDAGFLPSTGWLDHLHLPSKARIETGVEQGDEVSPYYDPMIAKIITHGNDREAGAATLELACAEIRVSPIRTNAGMLARTLGNADFIKGEVDTGFIARHDDLVKRPPPSESKWRSVANIAAVGSPSNQAYNEPELFGFRLNAPPRAFIQLICDDERRHVEISAPACFDEGSGFDPARGIVVFERGETYIIKHDTGERSEGEAADGDGAVLSPMPGKIVSVAVKVGAKVKKGDALLVLEAMKMEHTLTAPFDGKVVELKARAGEQVSEGLVLAKLEAE
jgi:3-methylcrotonyl-CoA carboxylase alpha subunit